MEKISVHDNFFLDKVFFALRDKLESSQMQWYFNPVLVYPDTDKQRTGPGFFYHMIYGSSAPCSPLWDSHFRPLMDQLDCAILYHIRVNLNPRLQESYSSSFHHDTNDMEDHIAAQWTTSILYINTNNGYTEFEQGGTKIESVANRLVSFPSNTKHRAVIQTDEQRRILINFNYLKCTTQRPHLLTNTKDMI